jgi:hypothetical protein
MTLLLLALEGCGESQNSSGWSVTGTTSGGTEVRAEETIKVSGVDVKVIAACAPLSLALAFSSSGAGLNGPVSISIDGSSAEKVAMNAGPGFSVVTFSDRTPGLALPPGVSPDGGEVAKFISARKAAFSFPTAAGSALKLSIDPSEKGFKEFVRTCARAGYDFEAKTKPDGNDAVAFAKRVPDISTAGGGGALEVVDASLSNETEIKDPVANEGKADKGYENDVKLELQANKDLFVQAPGIVHDQDGDHRIAVFHRVVKAGDKIELAATLRSMLVENPQWRRPVWLHSLSLKDKVPDGLSVIPASTLVDSNPAGKAAMDLYSTRQALFSKALPGTWSGSYACSGSRTDATFEITEVSTALGVKGVLSFAAPARGGIVKGSYELIGHVAFDKDNLVFDTSGPWINMAPGFVKIGFVGSVDPEKGTYTGVTTMPCKDFSLTKHAG